MIHTKIHLHSSGCPVPSIALQCRIVAWNTIHCFKRVWQASYFWCLPEEPNQEACTTHCSHQHKPEPHEEVDLLVVHVDGECALNRIPETENADYSYHDFWYTKVLFIPSIRPGCLWPSIALIVQNCGLKQQSLCVAGGLSELGTTTAR